LSTIAEVVQPPLERIADVIPKDPDDDPVLATAALGKAEVVCTLDRHFHTDEVKAYAAGHGFKIMTDAELLELLRSLEKPSDA
jgi:predicted nucleic acid-binding protein